MGADYEVYLDKIIGFVILLGFIAGTASVVFLFIENLTVAFTSSPLAGLFAGGIVSLLYVAAIIKLIIRSVNMSGGKKSKY